MTIHTLFPTRVYAAPLGGRGTTELNRQLLLESRQLRLDDGAGRRWSKDHYPGGFTSYGSAARMQDRSPTFARLQRALDRHVAR